MQVNTQFDTVTQQAIAEEFTGSNYRFLAEKYGVNVRNIHVIIKAAYTVRVFKTTLSTLIDQGLCLSSCQLDALVQLLNELVETDVARRLQAPGLSGQKFCADAQDHPGKAPKSRLALRILGLKAGLQGLVRVWRRVRS